MDLEKIDHEDAWLDEGDAEFLKELEDIYDEREAIEALEEADEFWEIEPEVEGESDDTEND